MATLYLAGTLAYFGYLVSERGLLLHVGKGVWMTGFLAHSLFLGFSVFQTGRLPTAGLFEASLFFAWAVVLASYLSTLRYRLHLLGAFVLPLVFFLVVVAGLRRGERFFGFGGFSAVYFGCHTVLLFFSYAAFALAFVTALMYLILECQIKQKTIGRFYRWLPSLELLEKANRRFVALGVIGFSAGIVFGFLWARTALDHWFGPDPKIALSIVTWILSGGLFLGQHLEWIRGRRAMLFSCCFFVWVLATFLGVRHPTMFSVFSNFSG